MTAFDASRQDDLDGRLRAILFDLADQLSPLTVGLVVEMIDANEAPIALDMMSEMLLEAGAVLSREIFDEVAALGPALGLGPETAGRLRTLVTESE